MIGYLLLSSLGCAVLGIIFCTTTVQSRGASGGGRSGGGRSSGRSSWGSSSSSGSRSSSSSSWGSSSSSGSRSYGGSSYGTRSSSWGSSSPSRKSNSALDGSSALSRSWESRPTVTYSRSPTIGRPVQPVYNQHSVIQNNYIPGSSHSSVLTGYYLGTIMASNHYIGYGSYSGSPWYYSSYVPYRYAYSSPLSTSNVSTSNAANSNTSRLLDEVDVCTLARWNMELPYTELPNMIISFLVSDNISGSSTFSKVRFLDDLGSSTKQAYGTPPLNTQTFQIPNGTDLRQCKFVLPESKILHQEVSTTTTATINASTTTPPHPRFSPDFCQYSPLAGVRILTEHFSFTSREDLHSTRCPLASAKLTNVKTIIDERGGCLPPSTGKTAVQVLLVHDEVEEVYNYNEMEWCKWFLEHNPNYGKEEPFITAINRILSLYATSLDHTLLEDLVLSAKSCYVSSEKARDLGSCLDFSVDPSTAMALSSGKSLYGNDDLCRTKLAPDIVQCAKIANTTSCNATDLVNLNVFARNFYLCTSAVDLSVLNRLETAYNGGTSRPQFSWIMVLLAIAACRRWSLHQEASLK